MKHYNIDMNLKYSSENSLYHYKLAQKAHDKATFLFHILNNFLYL